MKERRVVITGMGAVTPIGNNVKEMWDGIKNSKVGIGEITKFDAIGYKVKVAAELKDINVDSYFSAKEKRGLDLVSKYAMIAAKEAMECSKIEEIENPYRAGVMIGTAGSGINTFETEYTKLTEKGNRGVSTYAIPKYLGNMLSANVSIKYGFKGKSYNIASACASGTHSIGEAYRSIKYGELDIVLAGGADACIQPLPMAGFQSLTALSLAEDVKRASIPFDKERSGFVLGEGAGVVVLEEMEHAKSRGVNILAEIVGYGATSDALHITSPSTEGSANAMLNAINEAEIDIIDIDLINAHGTSTQTNDLMESKAIEMVFGKENKDVIVQSSKSMIGHLLGAAGAVETIICVKELEEGYIHENVGLKNVDDNLKLNFVKCPLEGKQINYILNNSLAFGGQNAALILKKA